MDQYKFYDPSPPRRLKHTKHCLVSLLSVLNCRLTPVSSAPRRRGNWITLKMRKLIKPKSRERMRSLTLTPSRSELGDVFLTCPQDSQDSSSIGSGSNSLDDTLTQKRSGSKYSTSTQTHIHGFLEMRRCCCTHLR